MTGNWRQLPGWVLSWFYVTAVVCIWDASFITSRPHSLPGGSHAWIWYLYKYYVSIDKRYLDTKDPFVKVVSLQNYIEVLMNIATVVMHYNYSRHTRVTAFAVSTMTFWKTVTYFLMFADFLGAGEWIGTTSGLKIFFLFYVPNGIWVIVPLFVMIRLWSSLTMGNNETTQRITKKTT